MSRGPGIWQRRILDTLEDLDTHQFIPLWKIVDTHVQDPTRTHDVAARRAARRLSEEGKIKAGLMRLRITDGSQRDYLVVTHPDSPLESNVYYGDTATPSWHTLIPAKYQDNHREWNPHQIPADIGAHHEP